MVGGQSRMLMLSLRMLSVYLLYCACRRRWLIFYSTSNDIAQWCASNMDTMRRVFKWGGLLVVGGPDEKGAPRTFM